MFHYGPWTPDENELRLLGDVDGRRILELGCGDGRNSLALAWQGAHVAGIDLSGKQIVLARRSAAEDGLAVNFQQGDAANLDCFGAGSFDVVFSIYTLQYVVKIEACLAEVHRVLGRRGRLVFSLDHPFWNCFWNEEEGEEALSLARSYFERGAMGWRCGPRGKPMRLFHRTVGDWVAMLHAAGFRLETILEPQPVLAPEEKANWSESYDLEMASLAPQTIIFAASKGPTGA